VASCLALAVSGPSPASAEPKDMSCDTWHTIDSGYAYCHNDLSVTWQAKLGVKCHAINYHWEWTGWYDVPPVSTRTIGPRHCTSGGVFDTTYQARPKR
jgi:hypothetical protein